MELRAGGIAELEDQILAVIGGLHSDYRLNGNCLDIRHAVLHQIRTKIPPVAAQPAASRGKAEA
jgi:hypothetical protein